MELRLLVAAAIYDFAAHLTCRGKPMTVGKNNDAAPMAVAVDEFLKLRGVAVRKDPPVKTWQDDLPLVELSLKDRRQPLCFREELESVINKWGVDSAYNVPDHILAKLVMDMMEAHAKALMAARESEGMTKAVVKELDLLDIDLSDVRKKSHY